jgi:phosphatidylinositol alpha-mannosyltransferase
MTYWTEYRPLRICIVVPYDLSMPGGGVKHHAFQLARALRAAGDEVMVLGPASSPIDLPDVVGLPGVVNVVSNGDNNRMGLFTAPWRVLKFFRENRFDVIHLHEPMVPSIAFWTAWLTPGVPKLTTFHAFGESPPWGLRLAHKLFAAIQFPFFQRAIAVSGSAASHAGHAWKRPIAIVPNGISTHDFQPALAAPSKELRLLFVGHLDAERKGFRYLLEAYGELRERGVPVTLDVVGPHGNAPRPRPAPGLTYHGPVSLKDLVHRYQSCDLFVAPSTGQESFGIVLLEAMAVAKPIICSDIEGYRHVVHPDGAMLVPPRDSDALVEAISTLAQDPARRMRMAAVNRAHVKQYDWDVLVPRLKHHYLEAIADRQVRLLPSIEPWAGTQSVSREPDSL